MAAFKRKPTARKERKPAPPTPEEMSEFPKRLMDLITEQGKNFSIVSEMTGFEVPTISGWANGTQYAGIKAANLIVLAEKLGVRYAWLLTGEGQKSHSGRVATIGDPDILRRLEALERAQSARGQVAPNEGGLPDNVEHKSRS